MKFSKCLISAAIAVSACVAVPAQAELKSITIGTNPNGSVFFLLGGGFAKLFQEKLSIRSTAQPHGGSSVYLPMLAAGEMTLGLSSTIDAGMAYSGTPPYSAPLPDIRALGRVWIIPYGFITTANSGIKTMEDLKGKRIMGDMPTNVALTAINKALLGTAGLTTEDVQFMRSGGLIDGIQAVAQGRADATPVATSMPVLAKTHASIQGGLRVIHTGKSASDEYMAKAVPGTRTMVAKPNQRRPYIAENTNIIAYDTLIVGNTRLSDDDAYRLTKTLHDNWPDLQKDYGPLRGVSQEAFVTVNPTVPYHAGAIRFFKEVGLWSEAHEAHQATFK